jgi:hypothetical protein
LDIDLMFHYFWPLPNMNHKALGRRAYDPDDKLDKLMASLTFHLLKWGGPLDLGGFVQDSHIKIAGAM